MRAVGLVSGGKDSCYNLLQCIAAGHEIVALANLSPKDADEIDSFMYQSVGHSGIELYADALGLPLFRRHIEGSSLNVGNINYTPTEGDEVEDLYQLLKEVKESCNIQAVSVGAVLSDYQRVRVENVCGRLGLVSLCYLWQRNQSELLEEMIKYGVQSIIIKVAAVGLVPSKHLGKSIGEMSSYLHKMKEKYHLNVCGEGGEYESFTLDCALFRKRIVVDEIEVKELTGDVGYINFKSLKLVDKNQSDKSQVDLVREAEIPGPHDYLRDLILAVEEQQFEDQAKENSLVVDHSSSIDSIIDINSSFNNISDNINENINLTNNISKTPTDIPVSVVTASTGYSWVTSIKAQTASEALSILKEHLEKDELFLRHVVSVNMYISDMADFAQINAQYVEFFNENPPSRACIQIALEDYKIQMDVIAWRECHVKTIEDNDDSDVPVYRPQRKTMHVQSISHWAPANIGPYSQAVKVGHVIHVAGMIALVPGTMAMLEGGIELQARLSLRHVSRVLSAMSSQCNIRSVVQGICYVVNIDDIAPSRRMMARLSESQIVLYVVVPKLPRDALVEWHTWAHTDNASFHYEEKGYTRGNTSVTVRKRNSHNDLVCAVIANISFKEIEEATLPVMREFFEYVLSKLDVLNADEMCSCLTIYYVKNKLSRSLIIDSLSIFFNANINSALSMVPVIAIEDKSTLLSIYASRH